MIGLLEHACILANANIPYFSRDYPDCSCAYYQQGSDAFRLKSVLDAEDWKWGRYCKEVTQSRNHNSKLTDRNSLIGAGNNEKHNASVAVLRLYLPLCLTLI